MKKLIFVATLLLCVGIQAKELDLGSVLPLEDVKMMDITGKEVSLGQAKGENGLLVIFSSNTCPWVIKWEDRYVKLAKKYQSKGVGMIELNSNETTFGSVDSMDKMKAHAKDKGYNFYYAMDSGAKLAREFGATKTPHGYLFNEDDQLDYRGEIDDNTKKPKKGKRPYVADAIDAMLVGNTIKYTSTKALGCGIKFKD